MCYCVIVFGLVKEGTLHTRGMTAATPAGSASGLSVDGIGPEWEYYIHYASGAGIRCCCC